MAKKKLMKYAAVEKLPNVIMTEITDYERLKIDKSWDRTWFKKEQEITLELGCGKGEYTINLAKKFPERNFIGVDLKGDRMWHGAQRALEEGLDNVLFLRIRIEFLADFFPENSISEAWITFPDPYSKKLNGRKRLTSKRFLDIYRKILKEGSRVHLKTDDDTLYHFSRESILENSAHLIEYTDDLYNAPVEDEILTTIQTTYEKRYLAQSKTIKYLMFSL